MIRVYKKEDKIINNEKGVVLLIVLSITAFVIPMIYFSIEQQNFQTHRVANELNLHTSYRNSQSMLGQVITLLSRDGGAGPVDHLLELWALPLPFQGPENVSAYAVTEDAERYWNLNDLVDLQGQLVPERHELYLSIFEKENIPGELLDAIIDWIDSDDLVFGFGGAEEDYYLNQGKRYAVKNAPLDDLEELFLLRGWDNEKIPVMRKYFNACSACGKSWVNINTAGKTVLQSLVPTWSENEAERFLERRREKPFTSTSDAVNSPEFLGHPANTSFLTVESNFFYVRIISKSDTIGEVLEAGLTRDQGKVEIAWTRMNR